jgi:DNA-binding NtrC family response regulator
MSAARPASSRATLLLVEDRASMRQMMAESLLAEGYAVTDVDSGEAAAEQLRRARFDLIVSDFQLPGMSGVELLRAARELDPLVPVVLLTAFGTVEVAVQAMKEGAYDFLTKPVDIERLLLVIERALEKRRIVTDNMLLKEELRERLEPPVIVGEDESIKSVLAMARKAAASDATVLILGESGTGKELVARFIHHESPRAAFPLVTINCATIPGDLLEHELFGSERGAFTGADRRKLGRIELANRGTVFLDEIGDLPVDLQAKLLRVIQERRFERVGGTRSISVDVRIVAATNKNLRDEVKRGAFRDDLFYRLNVIPLELPPLRERPGDVVLLARWLAGQLARGVSKPEPRFTEEALAKLAAYSWPGNIRELRNAIERAIILCDGLEITAQAIALPEEAVHETAGAPAAAGLGAAKRDAMRRLEIDAIRGALEAANGNKAEAARRVGLSYRALWAKVKEYGLESEPKPPLRNG